MQLIWFIMQESVVGGICYIFTDDTHQRTVIKILDNILLWARILSTMMKGDAYANGRLLPPNTTIQPFECFLGFVIWNVTAAKDLIDRCPVRTSYITGVIAWVSDNIQKLFKAGLGLLMPMIPIPVPKK